MMNHERSFNSEFCGSLPLHHINSIQDHGYLLAADITELKILQLSENFTELMTQGLDQLVGLKLDAIFRSEDLEKLNSVIQKGLSKRVPLILSLKEKAPVQSFHALVHLKESYVMIELEAVSETSRSFTEVYEDIRHIGVALEQAQNIQQLCDITVAELRKLSGFDGVLMYRFDQEWNGTVAAEDKNTDLDPYLGQTFPASDIPQQARAMYLKNPFRLIPNRDFKAVRLYPVINPLTHTFIDLSDCNLRAVVGVHLEYMKNMNIMASMSIRVIYKQQLWGLISCHHKDAMYLNYELCSVFEWLSDLISNRLALILDQEHFQAIETAQQKRQSISDGIYARGEIAAALLDEHSEEIEALFSSGGLVLYMNGRMESRGNVPDKESLDNLLLWLEGKNFNSVFATDHLSELYEDAKEFTDAASGLLFIPIESERGEFLVCFRPELLRDINWGGNPDKTIHFDEDGKNYHPRTSFESWKETVSAHSLPWQKHVLDVAESLRSFLFEFRTRQLQN